MLPACKAGARGPVHFSVRVMALALFSWSRSMEDLGLAPCTAESARIRTPHDAYSAKNGWRGTAHEAGTAGSATTARCICPISMNCRPATSETSRCSFSRSGPSPRS